jgi:hypothetical protein
VPEKWGDAIEVEGPGVIVTLENIAHLSDLTLLVTTDDLEDTQTHFEGEITTINSILSGLGTLSAQNADSVAITGGTIAGTELDLHGQALNLNDGSGAGGGTLSLDNGTLFNVGTIQSANASQLQILSGSSDGIFISSANGPGSGPVDINSGTEISLLANSGDISLSCSGTIKIQSAINFNGHMPTPSTTVLGDVKSYAATTHQFLTQIGTDGTVTAAQPAIADLSDSSNVARTNSANTFSGDQSITGSISASKRLTTVVVNLTAVPSRPA